MTLILSMDVEASGPCPNHGDMISFAAIVVENSLQRTFYSGNMRPECNNFSEGAYQSIGMTREEHLNAPISIEDGMKAFETWLLTLNNSNDRFVMLSDNPGFDFSWMNFELHNKIGKPLLGHSARRIGDAWAGLRRKPRETLSWKRYRIAPHDHNPLNDAMGNAEAWLTMWELYGDNKK